MRVFIFASFLVGLRGEETLELVLGETHDYIHESKNHRTYKHVDLPFRGRFKGGSGENFHFVAFTTRTDSDLCIGPWVRRALDLKENRNLIRGFFFVNNKGKILFFKGMEVDILYRIAAIQSKHP